MSDPQTPRMNHNLAILGLLLALGGMLLVWLLIPSVIASVLAYRSIRREPERYSGMLFVIAAWVLSLVVGGLYLVLNVT
ncbi:hypothetical protein [Marinospirillum perlucidum]|uniref:hypothetical protein n=1 Tax=Marinospirillum perlucidum TaxID=1982602 RepID=UPI000DF39FC5|nr:hypothetical protein [Marinospirillum perlucidum]